MSNNPYFPESPSLKGSRKTLFSSSMPSGEFLDFAIDRVVKTVSYNGFIEVEG